MDIVLPKNSLTMTQAEIIEWYVDEGGEVVAGEPLFLMETDKSQVDVEASVSGRLSEIRAHSGEIATAGAVIAVVDTGADDTSFTGPGSQARVVAPAAAELAEQLGIDIEKVVGSGSGGRVIEEDVLKAASAPQASADNTPPVATDFAHDGSQAEPKPLSSHEPTSTAASFSKNRLVGNRSTAWAAAVPTFQLAAEIVVAGSNRADGASASDLFLAAAATAARAVPVANAMVSPGGDVRLYSDVRVGLLVRDGDALLPLVFADPDRHDLGQLHATRRDLMAQVGKHALPADATAWPTIVVSNVGRPTVHWFSAVLYPGTSVTIAIGGLSAREPGKAEIVLTCDHRVLDGVDAADFATAFANAISEL